MMLDISLGLRSPGEEIPFQHEEMLEDQEILGEVVTFPEPVTLQGTYSLVEDELYLKGQINALAHASCARCLEPVTYRVSAPMEETYTRLERKAPKQEDPWEESLEFSGYLVDLAPLIKSLTLLELPIRFLCRKDCKGVGEQDETDPATQEETLADHPFGALRQLFTKDQEV